MGADTRLPVTFVLEDKSDPEVFITSAEAESGCGNSWNLKGTSGERLWKAYYNSHMRKGSFEFI
jgi:hypothetical protein